MRRRSLALCGGMLLWMFLLPLLVAAAAPAPALTRSDSTSLRGHLILGLVGGRAAPAGRLAAEWSDDGANMGLGQGMGAQVEYCPTSRIVLGGDFAAAGMLAKASPEPGEVLKARTTLIGFHGRCIFRPGDSIEPWVGVGFGWYNRKLIAERGRESIEWTDTKPGMSAGAGVDFPLNRWLGLTLGAAYHAGPGKFQYDVDGDGYEEVILEDWNYVSVNAGVRFLVNMLK